MKVYLIAETDDYNDKGKVIFYEGYLSAQDAYAIVIACLRDDCENYKTISKDECEQQIFKLNKSYNKYLAGEKVSKDEIFYCKYYKVIEREIKK